MTITVCNILAKNNHKLIVNTHLSIGLIRNKFDLLIQFINVEIIRVLGIKVNDSFPKYVSK